MECVNYGEIHLMEKKLVTNLLDFDANIGC
jgi:hypothetical protein